MTRAFQITKDHVLERPERSAIAIGITDAKMPAVFRLPAAFPMHIATAMACVHLVQIAPFKVRWKGLEECVLNIQAPSLGSPWAIHYTGKQV